MINALVPAVVGAALFLTYAIQWSGVIGASRQVTSIGLSLRIQANVCRWGGLALLIASLVLAVAQQ